MLVGPETGPPPERDLIQLIKNNDQTGRFTGTLSILKKPYTGEPIPLGIPVWEGLAVSRHSLRIVWSDTRVPYFSGSFIKTGIDYLFARSNLWTGEIKYDNKGMPYMAHQRKIVKKHDLGFVFLEPQNFMDEDDSTLILNVYGPFVAGTGDPYIYDFKEDSITPVELKRDAYNEWEGISHDYKSAFVEIDEEAWMFSGPGKNMDLYIYNFDTCEAFPVFDYSEDSEQTIYWHECSFSPDGKAVLMNFGDHLRGFDLNTVEFHNGFLMIDKQLLIETARQKYHVIKDCKTETGCHLKECP